MIIYVLICNKSFISLLVVLWQISFSKNINNICHLRGNSRNLLLDSISPSSWNWKSLWLLQLILTQLIQGVSLGCKWLLKLLRLGHRKRELLLTLSKGDLEIQLLCGKEANATHRETHTRRESPHPSVQVEFPATSCTHLATVLGIILEMYLSVLSWATPVNAEWNGN